jgi:hypothetical protein
MFGDIEQRLHCAMTDSPGLYRAANVGMRSASEVHKQRGAWHFVSCFKGPRSAILPAYSTSYILSIVNMKQRKLIRDEQSVSISKEY